MRDLESLREQHKRRLAWMPWLYFTLKARHRAWAEAWQAEVQACLLNQETVQIGHGTFVAPDAGIFGEPGRDVVIGDRCAIATQAFLHGPITLGNDVSVNAGARLDGGRKGLVVGDGTRIASGAALYAFDHGLRPDRDLREQPVHSRKCSHTTAGLPNHTATVTTSTPAISATAAAASGSFPTGSTA